MSDDNTVPVAQFDTAAITSVTKAIIENTCPQLTEAIDEVVARRQLQSTATREYREESERDRELHRRNRSRPRSPTRSRSRRRSPSSDYDRSRTRSPLPTSRRRMRKSDRDGTKYHKMQTPYKKSTFASTNIRYEVNKKQLEFNEDVVASIHDVAQTWPPRSSDTLRSLVALKVTVLERQEDVLIADKYGLEIAGLVDKSKALPISKAKQKKVDKLLLTHGTRSAPSQPPFRSERGGQPRVSYSFQPQQGPFTSWPQSSQCFKCGSFTHWSRQCTANFGAGAFNRTTVGSSGAPKPLFGQKSN